MIGIIGGTGLYSMDGLENLVSKSVDTPFGPPSAPLAHGRLDTGGEVVFLPRHGLHHNILPSEINYRANIWALKAAGAKRIISVSAVGSLVKEIAPGHLALASQYLDLTKGKRAQSFFGDGLVAHISSAEPACSALSAGLAQVGKSLDIVLHTEKTYACVEGPRLGTRAESFFLKGAGCHLVGMTNVPEAFLAREAQLCYCTVAVATDFDCWMDDPTQHVTLDKLMALYSQTLGKVKTLIKEFASQDAKTAPQKPTCACRQSLKGAVLTSEAHIPPARIEMLNFLRQ